MQVSIVVAAAENDVIGDRGDIPWKLPDDQRHFKTLTLGHHIVMGRLTYQSIGRLLPGRTTIVISSRRGYGIAGAHVVASLDAALDAASRAGETEVLVVGGERIYALALPVATHIHLTRVHAEIPGDTRFPDREALARAGFTLREAEPHAADERHAHAFTFEHWEASGDVRGRAGGGTGALGSRLGR